MIYYANPTSSAAVHRAMAAGLLGYIDTPRQGNVRPAGLDWCADNGAFSDVWEASTWWGWLEANAHGADACRFAVAPDVVADAWRSHLRAMPWLSRIRELGYPVAYVAQDGLELHPVPWHDFDCLFIGGSTAWKLGPDARRLVDLAIERGKWVHMGRVNTRKRLRYAHRIGCHSVDGTTLTRGPDKNLPPLLAWLAELQDQPALLAI